MRPIGFSTGSLAKGDYVEALGLIAGVRCSALELSALREDELKPLLRGLHELKLTRYKHLSLHVPSSLRKFSEREVCSLLKEAVPIGWPLVVHPDVITDPEPWRGLGSTLCLENMDARKNCGRSSSELSKLFDEFPEATLCLDLGHAKQIDPSMFEAREILRVHGSKLAQIHLSEVNSSCMHERLNRAAIQSYQEVAEFVPAHIPIIIESPVSEDEISQEIKLARKALPLPFSSVKLPTLPEASSNHAMTESYFKAMLSSLFTKMGYHDFHSVLDREDDFEMWKSGSFGKRERHLVQVKTFEPTRPEQALASLSNQIDGQYDSIFLVTLGRIGSGTAATFFDMVKPADVHVLDNSKLTDLLHKYFPTSVAKPWMNWVQSHSNA